MKTNFKFLAIIAFTGVILQSCSNDDDNLALNAPAISNFEYGEGSSHSTERVAYKGSDIHFEAEISAEAVVSSISLDIHAHDLTPGEAEVEWDHEQIFTDTAYLVMNPIFHEHIDVPSNIPAGEYHITLTVTDELGNSTEIEGHIDILDPIGLSDISIASSVVRGDDFHAEFMVHAVHGVHNITVDIHAHGITPGEGEVEWHFEEVFTEGYHDQTEVEFHKHIDVPVTAPAGEYHMVFTVEDDEGNTVNHSAHIDVATE
ncbi:MULTISPECIES: DUF4625 domain-containing protein [unclassified Arenibacter]|uniref:DUF4625 domain-containing protein n=1 Tax=unclassified Arenibacter TaxID=2615047 RepID=UPI000E3511A1|nr:MULTISPECIES: DUF4625 domain-containing protein [unclassified Arenibacter]MCM4163454.1 protein containing PKD domain-containing protein [Arenibacter sp. A80]RFT57449.1 DUF4625 domain-containing protein [Arenibacter sp. P308M17]